MAEALGTRADLLLRIGRDDAFDPAEGALLSAALAALVKPHFAALGGLIATGGETARAMLSAAGIGSIELIAEIEAGVAVGKPVATCALRPHLRIVTKAKAPSAPIMRCSPPGAICTKRRQNRQHPQHRQPPEPDYTTRPDRRVGVIRQAGPAGHAQTSRTGQNTMSNYLL